MSELRPYVSTQTKGKLCAVYMFTNVQNGQQYVGSTRDIRTRMKTYFELQRLKTGSAKGSLICKAILKHGLQNFKVSVYLPSIERPYYAQDISALLVLLNEQ